MLCWSHMATSNTSSGSEPIGSAVALHHPQMWGIEGVQIEGLSGPPIQPLWVINHYCRCNFCKIQIGAEGMRVYLCLGRFALSVSAHAVECVIAASQEWVGAGGGDSPGRLGR